MILLLKLLKLCQKVSLIIFNLKTIDSDMPCFQGREPDLVLKDFTERFHLDKNDNEIEELISNLVKDSINSWRTYQYDMYQQLTNGIKP